jgi:hypothetical protein
MSAGCLWAATLDDAAGSLDVIPRKWTCDQAAPVIVVG